MRTIPPTQASRKRPFLFWMAAIASLALWLGFPNDLYSLPPLILAWPLALTIIGLFATSARQAFCFSLLGNTLGMTLVLYWLALPIHSVGGLPWFFAALCAFAVIFCLAAFFALHGLLLFLIRAFPTSFCILAAALSWTVLELASAPLTGFPWLPIAGALVQWPELVQSAAYVSQYGTGFFWLLALFGLILPLSRSSQSKRWLLCSAGALLLILHLGIGWLALARSPLEHLPEGPMTLGVLFVEGNVDQNQKWRPSTQRATVEHYRRLTAQGLSRLNDPAVLVIWPETAMPFFFERNGPQQELVRQTAREQQCPLLFGTVGYGSQGKPRAIFNRAILLDDLGTTVGQYDKEHLVPFGEYIPAFLDFEFLKPLLQGVGIYDEGVNAGPLNHGEMAAGLLICYEGIFPWLAQNRVSQGANLLIDISNDGWFRQTPALWQHLYLTCLRAIEQKRWILRGTNTGISAVIDENGRIVDSGPLEQAGSWSTRARLLSEPSFLHRTWFWQLGLFGALCLSLLLLALAFGKKSRHVENLPLL
ncbi:MAG: apolipoprotein N-acyltransferase [Desulfovibrio sp.]|nr:apolipoprotein N-acyltransferase [Desulfovibrio sp.]